MTELEKCYAGKFYNCHDKIFLEYKEYARNLLTIYNGMPYSEKGKKQNILNKLFGSIGTNVSVATPFLCDYGCNIHIGNTVSINMNCTFVDCNRITIGNHVLIASNVQIYTAAHPTDRKERLIENWKSESENAFCQTYARPVFIGDDCWIGGGVIILPGVTIGEGSVIGAGSVVTKNIPPNSIAVGNPCRVIKEECNTKRDCCL